MFEIGFFQIRQTSNGVNYALASGHTTVSGLLAKIQSELLTPLINLLFVLATVVFLWGVINYVIGSKGDQKKLDAGKQIMLWGIIGMAIMASAWGIVRIICRFFDTCT